MKPSKPCVLAVVLAALLVSSPVLVASAPPSGSLSGEVLGSRIQGAVVYAATSDATRHASAQVAPDGRFALEGLESGVWNLAVDTERGLLVASTPVVVRPGEHRAIQIALAPAEIEPEPTAKDKKKAKMTWWNNPLAASVMVVGAAVIVGVAIDQITDDDVTTSPSAP